MQRSFEYNDEYTSVEGDHGRVEERSYRVYDVPDYSVPVIVASPIPCQAYGLLGTLAMRFDAR